jgi:hypothetical protein
VGFQIAAYDISKPLIIDPVLEYSTYFGGSHRDQGESIAVDKDGNAYITGWTVPCYTQRISVVLSSIACQTEARGSR